MEKSLKIGKAGFPLNALKRIKRKERTPGPEKKEEMRE